MSPAARRNPRNRSSTWWRNITRRRFPKTAFLPDVMPVPVSGRVFDAEELRSLVDSSLDFWLTTGRFAAQFENEFARWFGVRQAILVNSGSSANLRRVVLL